MGKNKQRSNSEGQSSQKQQEDENPSDTKNKSKEVMVLGVYLHCEGCVETVVKSLKGFEGVEEIEANRKDHRVTVKGKAKVEDVADRLRSKSGKHVEIISPVQKKQQEKKVEEKKQEARKMVETVLKMHIHCEGCSKDVKHCLHKMEGVQTVNVDMKESLVTVKGVFEPKEVVEYISKRAGRHAEMVVDLKNNKNNNKNNKNDGGGGEHKEDHKKEKEKADKTYPQVPPGLVYAPQLFSDENPNACSIM